MIRNPGNSIGDYLGPYSREANCISGHKQDPSRRPLIEPLWSFIVGIWGVIEVVGGV